MLVDKIKDQYLEARKTRELVATALLSTLLGQIQKIAKDKGVETLSDADVVAEVKKFLKSNSELQSVVVGDSLVDAKAEEAILLKYVPTQLTEKVIEHEVMECIQFGKTKLGDIMGYFKKNYDSQYDGKLVSSIAKRLLGA